MSVHVNEFKLSKNPLSFSRLTKPAIDDENC